MLIAYIYIDKKQFPDTASGKSLGIDIITDGGTQNSGAAVSHITGPNLASAYERACQYAATLGADKVFFGARVA